MAASDKGVANGVEEFDGVPLLFFHLKNSPDQVAKFSGVPQYASTEKCPHAPLRASPQLNNTQMGEDKICVYAADKQTSV